MYAKVQCIQRPSEYTSSVETGTKSSQTENTGHGKQESSSQRISWFFSHLVDTM